MGSSLALLLLESAGVARGLWAMIIVIAAVCLGLLYVTPRMPRWASLTIIAVVAILPLVGSWTSGNTLAALGRPFSPFTGVKIVALVVAILCPSLWLGGGLIGLALLLPVLQTLHWDANTRSLLPQLEPLQSVAVVAFAAPCLIFRRRHAVLRRALARARAERAWLERLVRLALLVRNLTRAPLEATRNALSQMRQQGGVPEAMLARMENALVRLDLLNETIAPLGRLVPGLPGAGLPEELSHLLEELRGGQVMTANGRRHESGVEGEARRAVMYAGGLGAIGAILMIALFRMEAYPIWPPFLLGVPGLAVLGLAWGGSRRPARFHQALFAIQFLMSIACVVVTEAQAAQRGPFDAFIYMKFTLLVCAFLAPSGRLGAAIIGIASLTAVVETYLWFSPAQRARMPLLEPWLTVLIGLTALGVLAGQRQDAATARELAQARADHAWMSRVARLALSVRDFANTPLQILLLQVSLQRWTHDAPQWVEIEDALAQLQRLNETLSPLHETVEWGEQTLSFDALETIAAEVRETLRVSHAS
jgi:hypothetical protein